MNLVGNQSEADTFRALGRGQQWGPKWIAAGNAGDVTSSRSGRQQGTAAAIAIPELSLASALPNLGHEQFDICNERLGLL